MSTIEKAAARLAARGNPGVPSEERAASAGNLPTTQSPPAVEAGAGLEHTGARDTQFGMPAQRCELDLNAISSRGFLTPGATRTALAQQMRRLKRPLLLRMQSARANFEDGPPPNLIMVTSSLPGEGKTFTSINLAMSMVAEVGQRVLLVDADPSRGDISRQLGLPNRPGLSALLTQGNDFCDGEILDTNVERLSVLPAGKPLENIDELFASQVMAGIASSLAIADPNRIVIFDSAPLLATTESVVLAPLMGQIVVVVEANRTPRDALARVLHMLSGCASVSLVLNKSRSTDDSGYGYGAFQGEDGRERGSVSGEGR